MSSPRRGSELGETPMATISSFVSLAVPSEKRTAESSPPVVSMSATVVLSRMSIPVFSASFPVANCPPSSSVIWDRTRVLRWTRVMASPRCHRARAASTPMKPPPNTTASLTLCSRM